MNLVRLELTGFKSFAKKTAFDFSSAVVAIVGPNGSGKSNVAEAVRFVLGEQSMKSMRGKRGEDLIWSGSSSSPRSQRASASLVFDNSTRFLDIDYDEVVIERVVNRDGVNEYLLNGSIVRLKDILGLLAGANIGQSGHHIISQGEADKILSASVRERREILEDALGLKVYQYKKEEASRKLEKTEENMRQVEALRREVEPHLKFLKRQVEKLERAEALRHDAVKRFREYFAKEEAYLSHTKQALLSRKRELAEQASDVGLRIREARDTLAKAGESKESGRIVALSETLEGLREKRRELVAESARLEGELSALERVAPEAAVSRRTLESFIKEKEAVFEKYAEGVSLTTFVQSIFSELRALISGAGKEAEDVTVLRDRKKTADGEKESLAREEERVSKKLDAIRTALDRATAVEREKERAVFTLTSDERELRHSLEVIEGDLSRLALEEEEYKREVCEAGVLIGREAVVFEKRKASHTEKREEQNSEKRELQKIKIRLEEMGASGGDEVMKEYREASEREAFLERELEDLTHSAEGLKSLIRDLEEELGSRFKDGMEAINKEFTKLFALMFAGGSASLTFVKEPARRIKSLEDEDDDGVPDEMEKAVEGIDITLSIPRKRIRSLVMLSGGERALTSIALIFAMSSVNPPPFLVLDETDAALDEANSRRYGDMVEALSKKSQLILITHNRETMSRAGILYGVTMGGDGASKILSVKLEEAVQVAK